jgi:aspartate 1-decarboxylase
MQKKGIIWNIKIFIIKKENGKRKKIYHIFSKSSS